MLRTVSAQSGLNIPQKALFLIGYFGWSLEEPDRLVHNCDAMFLSPLACDVRESVSSPVNALGTRGRPWIESGNWYGSVPRDGMGKGKLVYALVESESLSMMFSLVLFARSLSIVTCARLNFCDDGSCTM